MKKTRKKTLGFLGLLVVIATTVFAATLPDSEANAVSSVTDTIQVRVTSGKPEVDPTPITPEPDNPSTETEDGDQAISGGTTSNTGTSNNSTTTLAEISPNSALSGAIVTDGEQEIRFSYESVGEIKIYIEYTDQSGVTHGPTLYRTIDANYEVGEYAETIDFSSADFGYGDYVIRIIGTGADGVPAEGVIAFSYYPLYGELVKDNVTGETNLVISYDEDRVARIKINLYDEAGNLVIPPSPIYDDELDGLGLTKIKVAFSEYNLEAGKYRIEFEALNSYGTILYKPLSMWVQYSPVEVPKTYQPSTLFSDTDYLLIGAIIFLSVGALFITIVAKRSKVEK